MRLGPRIRHFRGWALFLLCQVLAWPAVAGELLVDAAKDNDQARVAQLVSSGSDVNGRGERGATALHWVAFHGNAGSARLLIDAGAPVNAVLLAGSTPLHLAAYKGHTEIARLLLESGADANAKTRDGVTPLDWARRNGHQEIVALLADRPGLFRHRAPQPTEPPATTAPPRQAASAVATPVHRVQLFTLSSERRAEEAVSRYGERYADILQGVVLVAETVHGTDRPLFRVQSEPVSLARARAICEALKRQGQACIVRAAGGP